MNHCIDDRRVGQGNVKLIVAKIVSDGALVRTRILHLTEVDISSRKENIT